MKTMKKMSSIMVGLLMVAGTVGFSQNTRIAEANAKDYSVEKTNMKKDAKLNTYVIERDMPGAGALTVEQLKEVSQISKVRRLSGCIVM